MTGTDDFWVFGYGSLMWRPGFPHLRAERAALSGYRRSLCVRSFVHRGTPERPGLVLGLDRGGSCVGVAFKVEGGLRTEVLGYLRDRELVTNVYLERSVTIRLSDGRRVAATAFVVDRAHVQYAGSLTCEAAAGIVVGAVGRSGPNEDYLLGTLAHMRTLRIRDAWLEKVAELVAARLGPDGGPGSA